jgi:hypothetical protein
MFEMTMLGAVLATVIALLVTTRLPRRQPTLYDSEVSEGKILVGVERPLAGSLEELARALTARGNGQLKTIA